MILRPFTNRILISFFLLLIAFAIFYGIKTRSVTGIILSLTSLIAAIHFLNLLAKARRELEQEEETA